jgi:integrase
MARPRKGQLVWRKAGYSARYVATVEGVQVRRCVPLGTHDKAVAQAKLAALLAGNLDAAAAASSSETFEAAARRIVAASTIRTKDSRLARLVKWAFPMLGAMKVTAIRATHVKAVVSAAREALGETSTVMHILHDIGGVLGELWRDEVLAENVAKRVRLALPASTIPPRVVLSDEEFERLVTCHAVDLELRMLVLTSRCLGGMRASDLNAWDWRHVDLTGWVSAYVPRPKTDKSEAGAARHEIPGILRASLQAWWREAGCPTSGPVFPVRLGARAGLHKRSKQAYARRIREALWLAGVVRPLPKWDPANPRREHCQLQSGDEHNSRADFHSCRRAYATAAARAGLNVQAAMALADHGDPSTHMRYVRSADVLHTPDAMLPALHSGTVAAFSIPPRRRIPKGSANSLAHARSEPMAPVAFDTHESAVLKQLGVLHRDQVRPEVTPWCLNPVPSADGARGTLLDSGLADAVLGMALRGMAERSALAARTQLLGGAS